MRSGEQCITIILRNAVVVGTKCTTMAQQNSLHHTAQAQPTRINLYVGTELSSEEFSQPPLQSYRAASSGTIPPAEGVSTSQKTPLSKQYFTQLVSGAQGIAR